MIHATTRPRFAPMGRREFLRAGALPLLGLGLPQLLANQQAACWLARSCGRPRPSRGSAPARRNSRRPMGAKRGRVVAWIIAASVGDFGHCNTGARGITTYKAKGSPVSVLLR